jgi:hypothetical protein
MKLLVFLCIVGLLTYSAGWFEWFTRCFSAAAPPWVMRRWRSVQRVIYARSQVVGLAFNYYMLRRFMLYPRSPDMFELHNA